MFKFNKKELREIGIISLDRTYVVGREWWLDNNFLVVSSAYQQKLSFLLWKRLCKVLSLLKEEENREDYDAPDLVNKMLSRFK